MNFLPFVCSAAFCSHPFSAAIFPCTQSEKNKDAAHPLAQTLQSSLLYFAIRNHAPLGCHILPPSRHFAIAPCVQAAPIHSLPHVSCLLSLAAPTLCTRCLCIGDRENRHRSALFITHM